MPFSSAAPIWRTKTGQQCYPVSFNSRQRARAVRSHAAPSVPAESAPKHLGCESHICADLKVSHSSHIPTTIPTREHVGDCSASAEQQPTIPRECMNSLKLPFLSSSRD